ncbi:MAG: VOC family protein, partial [Nitrospinota bacterium]
EDAPAGPFQPQKLGHVVLGTKDINASVKFATDVLGFRVSDWLGPIMCFTRCNDDHHALTFLDNGLHNLQHIGFETGSIEDIKRFADNASKHDVPLIWGPGRHGPGNNLFSYVKDPDGNIVEIFAELLRIPDDEKWQAQVWDLAPRSADYWGSSIPGDAFMLGPGWSL